MIVSEGAKKREYVEKVYDIKEFKKLLRTRTNVLVLFMKTSEYFQISKYLILTFKSS